MSQEIKNLVFSGFARASIWSLVVVPPPLLVPPLLPPPVPPLVPLPPLVSPPLLDAVFPESEEPSAINLWEKLGVSARGCTR